MRPTVSEIQQVVSNHYRLSRSELLADRRQRPLVHARQIGMYLARKLTHKSLPDIGRFFGGRDHSTVLHACRKIEARLQADEDLAGEVELLRCEIENAAQKGVQLDDGQLTLQVLAARAVVQAADRIATRVTDDLAGIITAAVAEQTLLEPVVVPASKRALEMLLAAVEDLDQARYGRHEAKAIDHVLATARAARKAGLQ